MISTIVRCLGNEHGRWDKLNLQLGAAAARLEREPNSATAVQRAIAVWDDIQGDLWSHLQVEDELILSWSRAHDATSAQAVDALKAEHKRLRELVTALPLRSKEAKPELHTTEKRSELARTLLALARTLDSHVEHYETEVLPSILRGLFQRPMP
jgi:iron-sulfur cluster repair protein YtfE (RIC family)